MKNNEQQPQYTSGRPHLYWTLAVDIVKNIGGRLMFLAPGQSVEMGADPDVRCLVDIVGFMSLPQSPQFQEPNIRLIPHGKPGYQRQIIRLIPPPPANCTPDERFRHIVAHKSLPGGRSYVEVVDLAHGLLSKSNASALKHGEEALERDALVDQDVAVDDRRYLLPISRAGILPPRLVDQLDQTALTLFTVALWRTPNLYMGCQPEEFWPQAVSPSGELQKYFARICPTGDEQENTLDIQEVPEGTVIHSHLKWGDGNSKYRPKDIWLTEEVARANCNRRFQSVVVPTGAATKNPDGSISELLFKLIEHTDGRGYVTRNHHALCQMRRTRVIRQGRSYWQSEEEIPQIPLDPVKVFFRWSETTARQQEEAPVVTAEESTSSDIPVTTSEEGTGIAVTGEPVVGAESEPVTTGTADEASQ